MKDKKSISDSYYEYNQITIDYEQICGFSSLEMKHPRTPYQYNFNDIKTYINNGFLTLEDHFDKYYEKLDFKRFKDILTFLNKAAKWELVSFSVLTSYGSSKPYAIMYIFKREKVD